MITRNYFNAKNFKILKSAVLVYGFVITLLDANTTRFRHFIQQHDGTITAIRDIFKFFPDTTVIKLGILLSVTLLDL